MKLLLFRFWRVLAEWLVYKIAVTLELEIELKWKLNHRLSRQNKQYEVKKVDINDNLWHRINSYGLCRSQKTVKLGFCRIQANNSHIIENRKVNIKIFI